MKQEKSVTRLIVDLPTATHRLVKSEATWRGLSMKQYIITAIVEKMANDERLNKQSE